MAMHVKPRTLSSLNWVKNELEAAFQKWPQILTSECRDDLISENEFSRLHVIDLVMTHRMGLVLSNSECCVQIFPRRQVNVILAVSRE